MNKLQIINESISEIRDILNADCTSVTELPDLVRNLVNDPSKSGYTTAFVFSSELQPNTPTGGSLDTTTGLVVGVEEGWSQRVEEKTTTFKSRSISEPSSTNWMSFAIFGPSGERVTEWSIPVNLKGSKGEQGIPGQIGAQGPEGPKGEKGDSANSYRTVSVYTTTETIDTPAKPIGGKWNLETNEVTPPTTEVGVKWFLNADEPSKNNYLWMSQATFGETGDLMGDWCVPFRLTGEAGKNGADGRVTEFIYRLVPDFETYKKLKPWTNKLYSPGYEDDKIPLPNDDLNLSTKWTDQPSGITESMQIEVCCTRTRKGVEQPWSEWSSCVIWSKWGEDGMDGDGVEYIYLVTPDTTNEGKPIDSWYILDYFTPDRKVALNDEYYQQDEFCFNADWGYTGYDWSDEPKDVGPGKPLEWVMIRKKKKNGKGEVVWGEFSDPAIWGRFAEDGLPYLTSFVFTRSIDFPGQPTGGSYENPKPDQSIWSDSVPVISETMKGPVWMSTRVFYAGDINAFDKDWTLPKIIADTHDFQVEYSKGNENGLVPHLDPFTGDEDAWRAKQKADYGIEWGDDAQITDPTWMITSSCDNGVWKPWVLTRIKGEKGAAGQNGTSVEVRGKFPTLAAIKEEWREYAEDGTDFYGTTILHNGDAYFVEENGMLYIYNGGFYPGEETTFEVYWAEVQLTGEKGDSFYFYVAYCETLNEGATLYFDAPKKYIGTIISDKPLEQDYLNKWSSYKNWTKWLGEDGWGQEQIFLLTSKNASYDPAIAGKKPLLPVNEEGQGNVKEYLPLHGLEDLAKGADDQPDRWSDSPLTVSEDYPYCWVVSRSVPEFGAWKGDGSYASLYSRYSYDGKDGNSTISVNLTNDLAVIPMEGDVIDPEFIASHVVTTSLQVFIGDDPIPSNRTTVLVEYGYATWDESTDTITLNFDKLPANVNEIPIIVTVDGGSKHTVTWKLFKTDTAYEISPDVHVIKRYSEGDKSGQLEIKSFDVKVKKWDGEKWIASNKAVFVEITTKEGKQWYSNQSNVVTETSGGIATVDIGEIHDIKAITVYLTNDDKDNGARISFEDIAIVADGITGPQGPQGEQGVPGENGKDAVISQAMLDEAAANIAQGFYTKDQINALETRLNDAISSGDTKAIADAATALNTANEVNKELTSLQSKFNDDGTIKESILREEDIYNLSKAALGTDISENGVFAQQIVGLVGTYGKINVDNLVGDTISGKTVQSADANGNLGKAWKLENTGAGHIANGQISWNEDGSEVNLGSNVKISWSDNISDSDKATIKTYSQDGTVSNDVFNEEVGNLQTRMESVENDLPNYALLSELSNEVKKEVNGLGFVTDAQLNEYLKSSDLNDSIELYLLNSKSEVADIIGDSVLAKLDKEALSTELGKDYIKTGTTFTNTLFSGDIYGKSIKNDSSGSIWSIKEDGSASFCSGKIKFNKDGSGNLGAGLSWNEDGTTTLSNQLIFKSGYLTSGDYQNQISWDDEGGSIDLDLKQQWVLDTSIKYGTLYLNESQCQYNNITNINILNIGNYVSRIDNGDIPFVLGSETGMLILPGHSLFTGMTFDGNCYCPSNYYITKCSGGRDGNVNYITPWDNPGYEMSVRNYNGTRDVVDNTTSSIGTTLLDITVSCPKIVIEYDTDSVRAQKISSGGSDQQLFFVLNNTVATQRQYYINIYFYFNELCVGRYCVSGNAEIYDD